MSRYCLKILNHQVVGHPYIPICKFIISTSGNNHEKSEQSNYINPPLYDDKSYNHMQNLNNIDKQLSDQTYSKQFPISFPGISFNKNQDIHITLIQLTRSGRQKQIGFFKIVLNNQIIGKQTKHKIVKYEKTQSETVNTKDLSKFQIISIVKISVEIIIPKNNLTQNIRVEDYNRNLRREKTNKRQIRSSESDNQSNQSFNENEKFHWNESPEPTPRNFSNRSRPKLNLYHQDNLQANKLTKLQKYPSTKDPELGSVNSRKKMMGKIFRQNLDEEQINRNAREENVQSDEKNRKRRRRLKYILKKGQLQASNQAIINLQKPTIGYEKISSKSNVILPLSNQKIQRIRTVPAINQSKQLIEYFISNYETNENGCNKLSNMNILYESMIGKFQPKFITFLTYDLYEKVVRINCRQFQSYQKLSSYQHQQQQMFLLQTQTGQLRNPQVYRKFSHLKLNLPKHSLILRLQIILEDESIFIGTLANQVGLNIKSTLHLKQNAHYHQPEKSNKSETIILVVNITDLQEPTKAQSQSYLSLIGREQVKVDRNQPETQFKSPKRKLMPNEESLRIQKTEQRNDKILSQQRNDKILAQSKVQKALSAIKAYKICLSPVTDLINQNKSIIDSRMKQQKTQAKRSIGRDKQRDRIKQSLLDEIDPYPNRSLTTDNKKIRNKELPSIFPHQSNYKDIDDRNQLLKNIRSEIGIKSIKGSKRLSSNEKMQFKNQIRMEFLKKVLKNKFIPTHNKHYHSDKLSYEHLSQTRLNFHKSGKRPNKQLQQLNPRHHKLLTSPSQDLNQTRIFYKQPKNSTSQTKKLHLISPKKKTKKMTFARELRCLRNHSPANLYLEKNDSKKQKSYKLTVQKINFLKVIQNPSKNNSGRTESEKHINLFDVNGSDPKINQQETFDVFLKLYKESKRSKQFITSSQKLIQSSYQYVPKSHSKLQQLPESNHLGYMSCSWDLKSQQFVFKVLKPDDMVIVEAFGDLTSVDNNQFMGKCIFTVQEILYMGLKQRITGYMVKNGSIQSHITVYFKIQQNN